MAKQQTKPFNANQKVSKGYRGTYGTGANGAKVLIMESRSEDISKPKKTATRKATAQAKKPATAKKAKNPFKGASDIYATRNNIAVTRV